MHIEWSPITSFNYCPPLELWLKVMFIKVANNIGKLIYFDEKSLLREDKRTTWVLTDIGVSLEIPNGWSLSEDIILLEVIGLLENNFSVAWV